MWRRLGLKVTTKELLISIDLTYSSFRTPRAHEYGGTYGQGVVVRKYGVGSVINIRVELTANHNGYFEFALCPDYKTTSQECLDKNVLKLVKPQDNLEHYGTRFYPKEGNKVYEMKYRLPKRTCEHCVLQWRYIAGNNWGTCPNGTGAVGCGPQEEFRACADISISGKGEEIPLLPETTTVTVPVSTIQPEESYSPFSAILISIVSFLVVFLTFSLLYIHFYKVGKQVKGWIKGGQQKTAPLPPPRIKRGKEKDAHGMYEVNLKGESMA